jgi:hypothetical protein
MLIPRSPVTVREAETLDELREIIRGMWARMIGIKHDHDEDLD